MLKQFVIGVAVFSLLGVPSVKVMLALIGIEQNYLIIFLGGFFLALLLTARGYVSLLMMGVLSIGMNMSDQLLSSYGFDKTILLAILLAIVVFPSIHKVINP